MKTVTVAVIGAGFAGNVHCNAYQKINTVQIRLKTIMDNQTERAEALKERWGFEVATSDYDSVLADPEIDLIDITLPPVLHVPFAIRAMEAGKHVICEKPLSGYFGRPGDEDPIGVTVSKRQMYKALMEDNNYGYSSATSLLQNTIGCILIIITNMAVKKIDPNSGLF